MQPFRYLALAILLICSLPSFAQKEDWQPITSTDLQTNEVPGNPDAAAIQLYYANYLDHEAFSEFVYARIKILKEAGFKFANVEIPVGVGVRINNLKARTIHPDGSIVDFTGKPFEKTVLKGRDINISTLAFTLPAVTLGSIVEYKFKFQGFTSDTWILQHDLYTVRESFAFHPADITARVAWVTVNLPGKSPVKKTGEVELQLEGVPAFQAEAYMPPEDNYKSSVRFYYARSDLTSPDKFWEDAGKDARDQYDRYIGNHEEVKQLARDAIGNETDPEKKLRKLYARAQNFRNLSYEPELTSQERQRENIEDNKNLVDVVKHGYGDREEITLLFVAMARAAGFEAAVLLVSDRQEMFFSKEVLAIRQLSPVMTVVKLNGSDIYLQPGVRSCPFGLLRWMNSSTPALRPDKKSPTFINVPAGTYEQSLTVRTADVALAEDGTLKGEVNVEFRGQEALEHRLNSLRKDEAGRKAEMEGELEAWLPAGAVVKMVSSMGWETEGSLNSHFTVEVPGYATVTGKRVLVPPSLFKAESREAFIHGERTYPVYFPYAFTERDRVSITVPAGYELETVPAEQSATLDYASYRNLSRYEGKQLLTQRILFFNGVYFERAKYPELKEFFGKVQAGDSGTAVLRAGDAVKN